MMFLDHNYADEKPKPMRVFSLILNIIIKILIVLLLLYIIF